MTTRHRRMFLCPDCGRGARIIDACNLHFTLDGQRAVVCSCCDLGSDEATELIFLGDTDDEAAEEWNKYVREEREATSGGPKRSHCDDGI